MQDDIRYATLSAQDELNALIRQFGSAGLYQRKSQCDYLLSESGARYIRHVGANVAQIRDWTLDPIPAVIEQRKWEIVSAGLVQRTHALNHLFHDIYGSQQVIKDGVIPAALVYRNGGYLRPLHTLDSAGLGDIILSASDLILDERGQFCVVSDRVQAPSGMGYALQNRRVSAKLYPEPLFSQRTCKLYSIFNVLLSSLTELSGQEKPRIVVLTPGSLSETFYEQKLIAGYLGFPLVEGRDLSVSKGRVWFKSTEGEEPIDLIIRRVDQEWCDPVELRGDSLLGIPGLIEVVRQGGVILANPLGTGVLESPALLKYLPRISEYYGLGELELRSAKTWWGAEDVDYVIDQLPSLIVKPFQRGRQSSASIYGPNLSPKQLNRLREAIRSQPFDYVSQEIIASTKIAAWQHGNLVERGCITRAYGVRYRSDYHIMPGGFTRTEVSSSRGIFTNQHGAINKDTWIVGADAIKEQDVKLNIAPNHSKRASHETRVHENFFWLARYLERSVHLLTTVQSLIHLFYEQPSGLLQRHPLLALHQRQTGGVIATHQHQSPLLQNGSLNEVIHQLFHNTELGSLQGTLQSVLFTAENIYESWTNESREAFNALQYALIVINQDPPISVESEQLQEQVSELQLLVETLSSCSHSMYANDIAHQLFQVGLHIERGQQVLIKLRHILDYPLDMPAGQRLLLTNEFEWETKLFGQFTQHYQTTGDMLALLTGDHRSPHSFAHVIDSLNTVLLNINRDQHSSLLPSYREPILEMVRNLQDLRFEDSMQHQSGECWQENFVRWDALLMNIANEIEAGYCNERLTPRVLSPWSHR